MKKYNLYYAVKCFYCNHLITGNHKEAQTGQMWQHIIDKHVQPPIVVRTNGKGEIIKK